MSRQILYMAHPVAPNEAEILDRLPSEAGGFHPSAAIDVWSETYPGDIKRCSEGAMKANIDSALRWLSWLRRSFPETTFIAPWIAGVQSVGSDGTPEEREAGMVDCCAVVERCDGIVLVGGRISSGMRREMEHGVAFWNGPSELNNADVVLDFKRSEFEVYDLTRWETEAPPRVVPRSGGYTFENFMSGVRALIA